jgi:ubiquinone/menaquinone biosynthesis C-methylase UbiE
MLPRMFIPWANQLLDVVGVERGDHVLDVACGPGSVAHLAAARSGPSGCVLGCDLNQAMLDLAAENAPHADVARIEWRKRQRIPSPRPTSRSTS